MTDRRMEQLYVFISRLVDDPPATALSADELARRHTAYLQDLFDRKILMGSGPALDEAGARHAGGVVILRAQGLAQAREIAAREPYCAEGQRSVEVIPWRRTWFGD